jgi:hypothetical protein
MESWDKKEKIEAIQSLLAPIVRDCVREYGHRSTYHALKWFATVVDLHKEMPRDEVFSEDIHNDK